MSGDLLKENMGNGSGVWLLADPEGLADLTLLRELITPGREMADRLGAPLAAILIGPQARAAADELAAYPFDELHILAHPMLAAYEENLYAAVLAQLTRQRLPQIFLAPATIAGRAVFSRLAGLLATGLTADCTRFHLDDTGLLHQVRPALGGNIYAEIVCPAARPQMATCRPGSYSAAATSARAAKCIEQDESFWAAIAAQHWPELVQILANLPGPAREENLRTARVIVAGGLGIGGPEGFELLAKLAHRLGGTIGASRAVIEAGWQPSQRQIGQTGATVSPDLYLAVGISGAPQHLAGMQNARHIIAINRDPGAPIFAHAHTGLVADWRPVIASLLTILP